MSFKVSVYPQNQSLFVIKLGTIITVIVLSLLAIIPSLHYFSKESIFNVGGIDVTIGFLVIVVIFSTNFVLVLLGGITRVPALLVIGTLFVIWGTTVAIFQSVSIRWWLPPLLRWGGNILIAVVGYYLTQKKYLTPSLFRGALLIALIIPLAMGIVEMGLGLAPLLNGAYRISSTFNGSPLGYSLFLSGTILMLLSADRLTLLYKIVLALSLLMMVSTYSRLTLVALAISIVFVLFFQKRFKIVFSLALLLSLLLVFVPFMTEQVITRFSGLSLTETDFADIWAEAQTMAYAPYWWRPDIDSSSLLRVKTLVIGLDFWRQSPLQGNGFGSFVPNYEAVTGRSNVAAHNDYLLYLVETGVIGLMMYLMLQISIVAGLLRKIKGRNKRTRLFTVSIIGAYLAINILSFLSNSYYFYEIQLWIWLGVGMALALIKLDQNHVKPFMS